MRKAYFSLMVYNTDHNKWYQEFGDYDKAVVQSELDHLHESYDGILKQHMAIVKSGDTQIEINNVIKKVNGVI
tara:strand:- start:804 stop:1022 length:219 start_codon:yes stop_codon:yes gene_type:complete